jgi:phage gp37-like protein
VVWGSRGSTELLNGEKKTRRSGEVLTGGRDAGRWPNPEAAVMVVGRRRTFGSNRTDRERRQRGLDRNDHETVD